MISMEKVPAKLSKLATMCFLMGISSDEFAQLEPTNAAAIGAEVGLDVPQIIECMRWLSNYHELHGAALEHWKGQYLHPVS